MAHPSSAEPPRLPYHDPALAQALERLPASHRIVFAALCAERFQPFFASCSSWPDHRPEALARLLDALWSDVVTGAGDQAACARALVACERLMPGEDELAGRAPEAIGQAGNTARDALLIAHCALSTWSDGEVESAVLAAQHAYDAVDSFIGGQLVDEGFAWSTETSLTHPLALAELARQRRDLDDVTAVATGSLPRAALEALRRRAAEQARLVFDRPLAG